MPWEVHDYSLVVQSQCFTNSFEGKVPLAYPSVCTGPPGKDVSGSRQQRSTTSKFNTVPSEILQRPWWTEGCWCKFCGGVFVCICVKERETHTEKSYCYFTVLVLSWRWLEDHTRRGNADSEKVFPNVSFIFQHWHTAAASHMNKVYLETQLELNCKQIWMFYGWS